MRKDMSTVWNSLWRKQPFMGKAIGPLFYCFSIFVGFWFCFSYWRKLVHTPCQLISNGDGYKKQNYCFLSDSLSIWGSGHSWDRQCLLPRGKMPGVWMHLGVRPGREAVPPQLRVCCCGQVPGATPWWLPCLCKSRVPSCPPGVRELIKGPKSFFSYPKVKQLGVEHLETPSWSHVVGSSTPRGLLLSMWLNRLKTLAQIKPITTVSSNYFQMARRGIFFFHCLANT